MGSKAGSELAKMRHSKATLEEREALRAHLRTIGKLGAARRWAGHVAKRPASSRRKKN